MFVCFFLFQKLLITGGRMVRARSTKDAEEGGSEDVAYGSAER